MPPYYWNDKNNIELALNNFVNLLIKDNIINSIVDIPNVCNYNLFKKYKLGGLVANYFNYSPFEAINFLFPNKFNEWDFKTVPKNFYKDNNNIKRILNWLVNKLLEDHIIDNIDDIPNKVNISIFKKYNLLSFLSKCFSGVSYKAFDFLYPQKWQPWEFRSCPNGFWASEKNVFLALNWFINKLLVDNIITNINDLARLPVTKLMYHYNLKTILKIHRHDIGFLFSKYYPNYFNKDSFGKKYASDGTKLDSTEEVLIHEWLIKYFNNVKYYENNNDKNNKWYNKIDDENYVADWLINNNIIVEYFGFLNHYNKNEKFSLYAQKTERKIKYFSSLDNYYFVDLYHNDTYFALKGVKEKLIKYI